MKTTPLDKQSKKARGAYFKARRGSWNGIRPVTRTSPSGKLYRRKHGALLDEEYTTL